MSKKDEKGQSRATTWFKFYSENHLWGSTRAELNPDERAVWVDFLCLGTMNFGEIGVFSRDQLAQQLLIDSELLDRSIDKFIKYVGGHPRVGETQYRRLQEHRQGYLTRDLGIRHKAYIDDAGFHGSPGIGRFC